MDAKLTKNNISSSIDILESCNKSTHLQVAHYEMIENNVSK